MGGESTGDLFMTRTRFATPEEILVAIVELAGDGFCARRAILSRIGKLGERDLRRAVRRAAGRGLVLERWGPDGETHVAVTSEGWSLLRSKRMVKEGVGA